jgi:hypothetical protein
MIEKIALMVGFACISQHAAANLCQKWADSEEVGRINASIINEASGLAMSRAFPGRLYHNNDSGDGPNLYVTNADGSVTQAMKIRGFSPEDAEDLAIGSCGATRDCIFVGDIGDNRRKRAEIAIAVVEEPANIPVNIDPITILKIRYPDGPHNAEGLAVHPNGDLYILTKELDEGKRKPQPAQLFRLKKAEIESRSRAVKTLERIGELDLPKLLEDQDIFGQIVTSLDISVDGRKLLILTYNLALEVEMDLSKEFFPTDEWILGKTYNRIPTANLPQQEAATYGVDGKSIYYDSEDADNVGSVPLMNSVCEGQGKSNILKKL